MRDTTSSRLRVLVVQHEDDGGLGRLRPAIAAVADLDVRHADAGDELPATLEGYDGLVVLGGAMAAWEDDVAPWLPATRRLLAEGVERGLPTLGICLGCQLLALATGGRVERGATGVEVGVVPVRLAAAAAGDALLGPVRALLGDTPLVPQFHQDAITELPAGAVGLAANDRYPYQAFRLGERAWGLQFHPEVTPADWAEWLRDGHGSLQAAGLDVAAVDRTFADARPVLGPLADSHARAFADVLLAAADEAADEGDGSTELAG